MCERFLTQKVPDNARRPSRDEDDDDEDEAHQPFREAPPLMGRIRVGARFLKHDETHEYSHIPLK